MDKSEIGQCSRCDELYSFDDSSPKPTLKSKHLKRKRPKLNKSYVLSPKDKENNPSKLKLNIAWRKGMMSHILGLQKTKGQNFQKTKLSSNFAVEISFQIKSA